LDCVKASAVNLHCHKLLYKFEQVIHYDRCYHHSGVARSGALLHCCCSSPLSLYSFVCPLAVFPFKHTLFSSLFSSFFNFLSAFLQRKYLIRSVLNLYRMSRQQYYPATPLRGTNPFASAEPIYETGPPIIQPRRDQFPYSPRNDSDAQDDLNPFHNPQMVQTGPIPLVAPRPGYATNISALTLNYPSPVATPVGGRGDMFDRGSPAITVPKTPHPLQPPVTPIAPVFARPKKMSVIKFAPEQPIIRGEREETLLPKRGENGDQFWKRFSMVAKVENNRPSTWFAETSVGQSRFNRWIWFWTIFLASAIVGASVLGWYMTRNNPSNGTPTAVGGKDNEQPVPTTTSSIVMGNLEGSSRFHVSPTLTVVNRAREPSFTGVVKISGLPPSHQHKRLRRGATHLQ